MLVDLITKESSLSFGISKTEKPDSSDKTLMLVLFVSLFLPIEKSGPINKDDIFIVDLILSINSFPVY